MDQSADELSYQRGYRDGLAGLNMSSTPPSYQRGYIDGRRKRLEDQLRYGCHEDRDEPFAHQPRS